MVRKATEAREDWGIERVLAGDGSVGSSGFVLHAGRFYASALLRGRHESFYEINIRSLRIRAPGATHVSFPVRPVTDSAKGRRTPTSGVTARLRKSDRWSRRQKALRRAVSRFCMNHPGVAVILGGPGARSVSSDLSKYFAKSAGHIFMCTKERGCEIGRAHV